MIYACHSYYSLLYGTMKVEDIVETAAKLGIKTLLLADINNSSACLDFVRECRNRGIRPICGIEFRKGDQWLYTCIACNNDGFSEINDFLSSCNLDQTDIPLTAPSLGHAFVIYPAGHTVDTLGENEFIGVNNRDIPRVCLKFTEKNRAKYVAFQPVSFAGPDDFELHRHLEAIGHNTILGMLREGQTASRNEFFVIPDELKKKYASYPDLISNAERLQESCSFDFDFSTPKNKRTFTGSVYEDRLLLEKVALEGMEYRYGKANKEAEKRIRHELEVIGNLGFLPYFLIVWDMLRYTLSHGINHVGRGSGGNSIVAYCLRITDIDPVELDLYFERFINPARTSPPDFDIDFSWKDRDKVHQYLFNRYGAKHIALLGATTTFQKNSIIRELGKVYGLPKNDIDALEQNPYSALQQNEISEKIFHYGERLLDFPLHRSIHAGGVLISELPLSYYTALDLPPKGFATTQWDMYVAESIGFAKFDILSQRGLGHIKDCVDLVERNRGMKIDIHRVQAFKEDPKLNENLYHGEAIGCFYIESPAMRGLLKKLHCNNYKTLVAASSIIRPGVAKSGMMREYIKRFHDQQHISYLHPVFEQQLKETFGVMVYQEDVIKIAHHFAGLTLSDADILRRAMSGKFRSKKEFERIQENFFHNCRERGYSDTLTQEVWRQMSSFAGYSFCKAHSASYAVESYQSLYLKTYFPHEFHVAVINNFGGFYQTWVYINEARRHGANIRLPDINKSEYLTTLYGRDIYLGLILLKNLEGELVHRIIDERNSHGEFEDLRDFTERVPVGNEQLRILIKAGTFRFTGKSKKQLMWEQLLVSKGTEKRFVAGKLFPEKRKEFRLPDLKTNILEDAYDEMELMGFPVSLSRFDMLQTSYRGNTLAHELLPRLGKVVRMVGDLVSLKYVFTVKHEIMHFGCFLDTCGEFFDTVHFPDSLKKYPFTGQGVYLLEGKVVQEFDYPSVEIRKMARLPYKQDPRRE